MPPPRNRRRATAGKAPTDYGSRVRTLRRVLHVRPFSPESAPPFSPTRRWTRYQRQSADPQARTSAVAQPYPYSPPLLDQSAGRLRRDLRLDDPGRVRRWIQFQNPGDDDATV